jgi:hypothetical protein
VNVSTRFIEYRPGYNEIESGSTWYDNSVLYVEETDSNRPAVIVEDQNILVDNDTLRLTAVQNDFSASGTRKVAVELYPTSDATNLSSLSGGLDVRIPTRLGSEDGYWNESIENGSVTYQGMNDTAYNSSEVSALLLRVDSPDNISVNSVGIQQEPTGETAKDNVGPSSNEDGDSTDPTPSQPAFGEFSASAAESNNNKIEDITIDGTTLNVDPNYQIQVEIKGNGRNTNTNSIQMTDPFSITVDSPGNPNQVNVTVDLIDDNGNVVENCESNSQLTISNSPLDTEDGDFTCT